MRQLNVGIDQYLRAASHHVVTLPLKLGLPLKEALLLVLVGLADHHHVGVLTVHDDLAELRGRYAVAPRDYLIHGTRVKQPVVLLIR